MTLLENLCKVNNQQGGIIHQFIDVTSPYYDDMWKRYYRDIEVGFTFESKASFNKLAKMYHSTINW